MQPPAPDAISVARWRNGCEPEKGTPTASLRSLVPRSPLPEIRISIAGSERRDAVGRAGLAAHNSGSEGAWGSYCHAAEEPPRIRLLGTSRGSFAGSG